MQGYGGCDGEGAEEARGAVFLRHGWFGVGEGGWEGAGEEEGYDIGARVGGVEREDDGLA